MDKIDRLMQLVQEIKSDAGVHIINTVTGYCSQCAGRCMVKESDSAVLILNDIPKNYVVKIPNELAYEYTEPEKEKTIDLSVLASLNTREQKAVMQKKIEPQNKETPYRRLFGYG